MKFQSPHAKLRSIPWFLALLLTATIVLAQSPENGTAAEPEPAIEETTEKTTEETAEETADDTADKSAEETAADKQRELADALIKSAELGRTDLMGALLQSGVSVDITLDGLGSPLIGAARGGQLAVVDQLLRRGADPNLAVPGAGTPLIQAAAAGHLEIVQRLLKTGADPALEVVEHEGTDEELRRTPLSAAEKAGHGEVVAALKAAIESKAESAHDGDAGETDDG